MPKKAPLSLLEIEQLGGGFNGIKNNKRFTICGGGTLGVFKWHFRVVRISLSTRSNIFLHLIDDV